VLVAHSELEDDTEPLKDWAREEAALDERDSVLKEESVGEMLIDAEPVILLEASGLPDAVLQYVPCGEFDTRDETEIRAEEDWVRPEEEEIEADDVEVTVCKREETEDWLDDNDAVAVTRADELAVELVEKDGAVLELMKEEDVLLPEVVPHAEARAVPEGDAEVVGVVEVECVVEEVGDVVEETLAQGETPLVTLCVLDVDGDKEIKSEPVGEGETTVEMVGRSVPLPVLDAVMHGL
jgi:hypothetical protein